MHETPDATETLTACSEGDSEAGERLLLLIYEDLRELASHRMANERAGHTLQPTALVHEAYLRLIDCDRMEWQGRTHFFAMAAKTVRRVLVDHARARATKRRGENARHVTLQEAATFSWDDPGEVLALDEALQRFSEVYPSQAEIVELRFFSGLTLDETAHALNMSRDAVKSGWSFARTWLNRELSRGCD